MTENIIAGKRIAVRIKFDVVAIEILCGDEYFATVLFDDIIERLQAGDAILIAVEDENK